MQSKEIKEFFGLINDGPNNLPKRTNSTKAIVTLLEFTKQRYGHSKLINLNNQENVIKKNELINIFNSVLYNGIKSINIAKVKKDERDVLSEEIEYFRRRRIIPR